MKVPYSWLQTFFSEPLPSAEEVTNLLDGLGLSVEELTELPGPPAGVTVVEVLEVTNVEGSTELKRVVVTDGEGTHQVVSGAPDITVGMRTALAVPGSSLPEFGEITARTMLGVSSEGMLCSPRELGLYDHGGGLLELADDAPVGSALADLWAPETVIELEVTPNRADAFSLLGVARDLGAKLGLTPLHPAAGLNAGDPEVEDGLELEIMDPACPRFTLRAIEGVTVRPSPIWLQRRLAALGLRPRNNLVDVTNFVTFELGQPSHAYDMAKLGGGVIQVRRANAGERLVLLTEEEVALHPEDLLIATPSADGASQPIGLAGVMGGLGESVTSGTTTVALEVANFEPVVVRRAGQRHKLITDARTRFERGVDPNLQELASARAAALIAEVSGGRVHEGLTSHGADSVRPLVEYRPARVQFIMDFHVDEADQRRYLEALGITLVSAQGEVWTAQPPSWRYDITIEEDLVEEVARLHGYEHIGESVPDMHFVPSPVDPTHGELRLKLAASGLQEVISYVFAGDAELARAHAPAARVRLSDPQGAERGVLRTALYPGLLAAASLNRRRPGLGFFEIGRVFLDEEEERLGLLSMGPRATNGWGTSLEGDYFTLKGILEGAAELVGAELTTLPLEEPAALAPYLHPGVAARVSWNGQAVGFAGRVHPRVANAYELGEVYVAELVLPLAGRVIQFRDINRQPHAGRDLAVILPADATFAELARICREAAGPLLNSIRPFDVYAGESVGEGKRSIALHLEFQADGRALKDPEVDRLMENVILAVKGAGYHVRA